MISFLICSLFVAIATFALGAIGFTSQRHASAWQELASERERLRIKAEVRAANSAWPKLVSTRVPVQAGGFLPSQRRISQRAAALPFQPVRRAVA